MLNAKKIEIPSKATLKLERIQRAVEVTGHPELGRKTILVAGTNGKGSTCAYLTSFFMAAGYRVGTYSSPHVIHRNERIRIDGEPISESEICFYENKFARILAPLTFFERYTLLAFLIFRDRKVDVQVLEVGLGGRLDATNISDPDLSVISRIDYDHQEILGKTLTKIAREKAGVMRFGRPALLGRQDREALKALKICGEKIQAEVSYIPDLKFSKTIERKIKDIRSKRGPHQEDNLRLALASFERAMNQWAWSYNDRQILKNLEAPLWPARIQTVRKSPPFVVDGSHNLNSIEALVWWLKRQKKKKWTLIFGAMSDKPVHEMIRLLLPFTHQVYLPTYYPERQKDAASLATAWMKVSRKKVSSIISANLDDSLQMLWKSKKPVLVVGSLYLAGAVLLKLERLRFLQKWRSGAHGL